MKPVVLPVLCHDSDTILFSELGINYNYEDLEEVEFMFFKIDYACMNDTKDKEYTEIVVGDEAFVVNMPFEQFKQLFI